MCLDLKMQNQTLKKKKKIFFSHDSLVMTVSNIYW